MSHLSLHPGRSRRLSPPATPRGWDSAEPRAAADPLRASIRRLDAWLRQRQGFVEFAASPACILRVVVTRADQDIRLSDGVAARRGDVILDIHFWNERIPQTSENPGLAWGGRFGRRLMRSLGELAMAVDTDPQFARVTALRARLAFSGERNQDDMRRFGSWFDFEEAQSTGPLSPLRRLHDAAEDVWLLALAWTFNPGSLRQRSILRRRDDLWISRDRMIARHGGPTRLRRQA